MGVLTPCLPAVACVSISSSYPGGGVQRETGGRYPLSAPFPALWKDCAFCQRHRPGRGQPDPVSLTYQTSFTSVYIVSHT